MNRNQANQSAILDAQIDAKRTDIRTDKLDMTFGEFASMYEREELVVSPDYQRLFRWQEGQKGRFIESILLGIPTPAIFVAEAENGIWELVDGLQRLSTVLEFFGELKDENGVKLPASKLTADEGAVLNELDGMAYEDLSLRSRLSIRRAGCRVEVIKVGSGKRMKYDLFERLNTGGARLTEQEIRNCIFRENAPELMEYIDELAEEDAFKKFLRVSAKQSKSLYDRGLVLRFFALKNDLENFRHDVEPFITEFVHKVADNKLKFDQELEADMFKRTVRAITEALGEDSWRHQKEGSSSRAFSVYVFEALTQAVVRKLSEVEGMSVEARATIFNTVKSHSDFIAAVGPGGNTKARLKQRITVAVSIVRGELDKISP